MIEKIFMADKPTLDAIKNDTAELVNRRGIMVFDTVGRFEWTVPENVNCVYITGIGGGGGGGAGSSGSAPNTPPDGRGQTGGSTSFGTHLTLNGGSGGTYGLLNTSTGTARGNGGPGGEGVPALSTVFNGAIGYGGFYTNNSGYISASGAGGTYIPSILAGLSFGLGGKQVDAYNGNYKTDGNDAITYGGGGSGGTHGNKTTSSTYASHYAGSGGGGGTGAVAERAPILVTPNEVIEITIGEGGLGGIPYSPGTVGGMGGKGGNGFLIIEWW